MNLFNRLRGSFRQGGNPDPNVISEAPLTSMPARITSRNSTTYIGQIEAMEVSVTVGQGDDLVAKDRNIWGRLTTSDPYVIVSMVQKVTPEAATALAAKSASFSNQNRGELEIKWGRTHTVYKTRFPLWNKTIHGALRGRQALMSHSTSENPAFVRLRIFDEDQFSTDDAMGTVDIPLPIVPTGLFEEGVQQQDENGDFATDNTQWYAVPKKSAKRAKGRLLIRIQTRLRRSQVLVPGNDFPLNSIRSHNQKRRVAPPPTISLELSWNNTIPFTPILRTTPPTATSSVNDTTSSWLESSQESVSNTSSSLPTTATPNPDIPKPAHLRITSEMTSPMSNTTASQTPVTPTPYPRPMWSNGSNRHGRKRGLDLDFSLIAISHEGHVIMPDTLYYGNVSNSNRSVVLHQEMNDDTNINLSERSVSKNDISMVLQLHRVPKHVLAMYLVIMGPQGVLAEELNQAVQVAVKDVTPLDTSAPQNVQGEQTLCTFATTNACPSNATAMFLARISRVQSTANASASNRSGRKKKIVVSQRWVLTPMEESHTTAESFGSLIPLVKSYTRDLVPAIRIDPFEQVAILRRRQTIRLQDYCPKSKQTFPERITFSLSWDVLSSKAGGAPNSALNMIDLDVSVVCLDANLDLVDMVWWKHLNSKDYNIIHHGDEREGGDDVGKDEMIDLYLNNMNALGKQCPTQFIGFVINSYGGQGLHEVDRASCHWFDPVSHVELATFAMTKSRSLIGATAFLVGYLYRATNLHPGCQEGDWCLSIVGQPTKGRTVKENVEDLQIHLQSSPTPPPLALNKSDKMPNMVINASMPSVVPLEKVNDDDDFSRMESVTETSQSNRT